MKITDWPGVAIVLAILAVGMAGALYVGLPGGLFVTTVVGAVAAQVSRRRWPRSN